MGKCCSCCCREKNNLKFAGNQNNAHIEDERFTEIYATPNEAYYSTIAPNYRYIEDPINRINPNDLRILPIGFTYQQQALVPTAPPFTTRPFGTKNTNSQSWTCSTCHFVNHPEMPHCEKCAMGSSLHENETEAAQTDSSAPDQNPIPQYINQARQHIQRTLYLPLSHLQTNDQEKCIRVLVYLYCTVYMEVQYMHVDAKTYT